MADEKDNETPDTPEPEVTETVDEAPDAEAQQAETPEAEAPEPDAPDAEAADAPEAEVTEPDAPEVQADDAPEAEASEPDAPQGEDAGIPDDESTGDAQASGEGAQPATGPTEQGSPKEIRRRERSRHKGTARPARSAEQRHAERLELRVAKAKRRRARRSQERAKAAERRASAPAPQPLAPVHAPVEGSRRERQGIVVSDKAEKTITVRIDNARRHRRYEKIVRSSSTLHAHDENNDAHIGDVVRVIESRPLSKSKRWRLLDVLERAR